MLLAMFFAIHLSNRFLTADHALPLTHLPDLVAPLARHTAGQAVIELWAGHLRF